MSETFSAKKISSYKTTWVRQTFRGNVGRDAKKIERRRYNYTKKVWFISVTHSTEKKFNKLVV